MACMAGLEFLRSSCPARGAAQTRWPTSSAQRYSWRVPAALRRAASARLRAHRWTRPPTRNSRRVQAAARNASPTAASCTDSFTLPGGYGWSSGIVLRASDGVGTVVFILSYVYLPLFFYSSGASQALGWKASLPRRALL
ncbi:hypothetical protein BV25DRAFT_1827173 [Artomyces pyxidatus]|uniref:Uncharacterized protein n=1 Tax=Artomyces pyxidatus TaxID=48021 RepID=A0ACB8SZ10_9AGAM|nr:hypothetical protein BV25DRAFT_1827173 [Artomyces pyxidatus]